MWQEMGRGGRGQRAVPAALIVTDFEFAPLAHRQIHINVVKSNASLVVLSALCSGILASSF